MIEMKDSYKVFFSEKGLTSTSANMIANKAKEAIRQIESDVANIHPLNVDIELLFNGQVKRITNGDTSLEKMDEKIKLIYEAKALQAWLREALKAKEKVVEMVSHVSFDKWCKDNNIERPELVKPEDPKSIDELIGELPEAERVKIYMLQQKVATIGKIIHNDGPLATARKAILDKVKNPTTTEGEGQNMIIRTYTPSITYDEVNNKFNELIDKHREYQAQLNKIMYDLEKEETDQALEYKKAEKIAYAEYSDKMDKLSRDYEIWKAQSIKEAKDLKIVLPESLHEIYNKLK